jgi:chaperonin GroES
MVTLPFIDEREKKDIPLIVVEPIPKTASVSESEIFIPVDVGDDHEDGIVISSGVSSSIKPGSRVVYKKIDRSKKENYETLDVGDKTYDIIGENEIWEVDDHPFNRVFVKPISDATVSENEVYIPHMAEGITQKGIIYRAPSSFFVKEGDIIEYRKNTMSMYHSANVDGVRCDILYEPDIFLVNGLVSPYKIIVRIDLQAQQIKRQTSDMGIALSPLFQRMTRFLQYGKVMEIGLEAQKMYLELSVGNNAILHHGVEYDEFRILKVDRGQHGITHEYRVINCFDLNQREIFGKFTGKIVKGKMEFFKIVPFHKNIFLAWEFELLEKMKVQSSVIDINFSLDDCKNKEDLENEISRMREESVQRYKSKWGGYQADLALYDPNVKEENDIMRIIGGKIDALKKDAEDSSRYIQKDHTLQCRQIFPKRECSKVLTTYKYLYPINILGKNFLIAHSDLLIAYNNMDTQIGWQPIANKLLVQPVEDENGGAFYIPESARDVPQKALVVGVGKDIDPVEIQAGDTILHRKMAGTEIVIGGTKYLMLIRNDVFLSPTPEERAKQKDAIK